mmetsp:Transcript_23951/g.68991  ORF Transcript_23951/g.68991 Transcript_23951/m.68991 type:complete len:246 (-) Transcript_23951:811-1548(-)
MAEKERMDAANDLPAAAANESTDEHDDLAAQLAAIQEKLDGYDEDEDDNEGNAEAPEQDEQPIPPPPPPPPAAGAPSDKKRKVLLPSPDEAFRTTEKTFQQYVDAPSDHRSKFAKMEHVGLGPTPGADGRQPSSGASRDREAKEAAQRIYVGIPEPTWHVEHHDKPPPPEPGRKKRDKEEDAGGGRERERERGRGGAMKRGHEQQQHGDKKETVKDRERIKRMKGQSSQHGWKPEEFMRLRQQFD